MEEKGCVTDKGDDLPPTDQISEPGLRSRKRTNSYSSSVYDEENRRVEIYHDRPDLPCHRVRESLFSTSSGFHNFRGLLNWCGVMLVFTMGRAALENLMKYGILIDPINWYHIFIRSPSNFPIIWIFVVLFATIVLTFLIEKLASKNVLSERFITLLHFIILSFLITFPAVVVYRVHPHPFISSPLLSLCITIFLKLSSYSQTNKWCRKYLKKKKDIPKGRKDFSLVDKSTGARSPRMRSASIRSDLNSPNKSKQVNNDYDSNYNNLMITTPIQEYPDNLNVRDLVYFLLAPTVCYELNYPRTSRIRNWFLINRALESLFLWGLVLSLIQQWIYPTLANSVELFEHMNYPMMLERILKLAIPNHLIWLIVFYWIFHSCFNFQAELLRFGDRMFYKDWWNSENLQQFWSTWNIPIHHYALRHIYKPLLSRGVGKPVANTMVFIVSAFFHEYLFSIPLKMFRMWFFVSFMMQIPLVVLSSKITGKMGNVIIWLMLILGQPVALLMYFHDYYITHHRNNTMIG